MPATLTPPQLEPRRVIDTPRDADNGAGGRPPVDKRTGGNGDDGGDDFERAAAGRRGPRERLATARIGLAFSLFGILLIFVGLVSAFLVTKSSYHVDAYDRVINSWLPTALPTILWLNTAVLFISSVTAELARRAMFHEQSIMDEWFGLGKPTSKRATVWLAVTLVFGMLFLVGQWVAWLQLQMQRVYYASNSSGHFFYLITAAHALHLFIGTALLIGALAVLRSSKQFATRQIWVDTTVWYWHAMGVLWVALFVLLDFFQ